jgi:hypothetical protein
MSIAIVRATHICLRGSRIPSSKMSNRFPLWEDKAGLSLFRNSTQTPWHSCNRKRYERNPDEC